jgi:HEAT repeat protein/beta-lactamase regulating signal transducer with metallopeptidase domain
MIAPIEALLARPYVVEIGGYVFVIATVVLVLAWIVTARPGSMSAATRHAVWTVGLASLLIVPAISSNLPTWGRGLLAPVPSNGLSASVVTAGVSNIDTGDHREAEPAMAPRLEAAPLPVEAKGAAASPGFEFSAGMGLLLLWFVGTGLCLLRFAVGVGKVHGITRRATPLTSGTVVPDVALLVRLMGIRWAPRIVYSEETSVPLTWGLFDPVIMLPATAREWPTERFRVVVLHELAHVKRWDYAWHVVSIVARALYWPNPLVWTASRRAALDREQACDDRVLELGEAPHAYAGHLVELAQLSSSRQAAIGGAVAMAPRSTLGKRVKAVLDVASERGHLSWGLAVPGALFIGVVALTLAAFDPFGQGPHAEVIAGLSDPDPAVRQKAAWSLGEREALEAVPALIAALRDEDPRVRGLVAWALGEIKDRRAVRPLLDGMYDPDVYVRERTIEAIGEHESGLAVEPLIRVLDDPIPTVRAAAVWALGEIRSPDATEALLDVLKSDPDRRTLIRAAYSLANLRGRRAPAALLGYLHDVAGTPDSVRYLAAQVLMRNASPVVVEGLIQGLDDPAPFVREAVVRSLGVLGDERAVGALIFRIRDPDPDVRSAVAWALDEINPSTHQTRNHYVETI